jgi:hypothetical protein
LGTIVILFWLILASVLGQLTRQPAAPDAGPPLEPVRTGVERLSGRPVFVANGQPFFPIGVTYHFTRHRASWDYDLALMRQLGLNTVRADLAWRDVEPVWQGRYRFEMLDEFLAAAARHQLRVVLVFSYATSDVSAPWWYWLRYGRHHLTQAGLRSLHRAEPSVNDPDYRRLMAAYIARTVAHVKDQPALLAYQVLNEPRYSEHPSIDRSPHTVAAFRHWLEMHYESIAHLNTSWGADYDSFDAVGPPPMSEVQREATGPSVEDWRHFSYENLAEFVDYLADVIREADPTHAVLVAEMSWWWWGQQVSTGVSPWHVYRGVDVVGFDVYPESVADAHYYALNADMLARYWDKPVWVMELNRKDGRPQGPEIALFIKEAVDYGASGIFYFSWRDYWQDGGNYGLLDRWGRPKPQLAAYRDAVAGLLGDASAGTAEFPRIPDVYVIWPTKAVSRTPGRASPSWQVYETASRLRETGMRVGLVDEDRARNLPEDAQIIRVVD